MARVESKSILAKLLAMENLIVQVDPNAHTASFDPQSRVVQIPVLNQKYDEDFIYDGFVGHEIGHALWTPPNFKKYEGADEVPFPLLNVLEDIRIEKNIKELYPGTRKVFSKFGQFLFNNDFFGISEKSHEDLGILDRINIFSKVGAFSGIVLTDFEKDVMERALNTESFQDVINLAKELLDDVDANEQPQQELQPGQGEVSEVGEQIEGQGGSAIPMQGEEESGEDGGESSDEDGSGSDGEDGSGSDEEGEEDGDGGSGSDEEGEEDGDGGSGSDEEGNSDEDGSSNESSSGTGAGDLTAAPTMEKLNENMQKQLTTPKNETSKNANTFYIGDVTKNTGAKKMYKPANEVLNHNREIIKIAAEKASRIVPPNHMTGDESREDILNGEIDRRWKEFQKENKHVVDSMVKEFEMKKAADESKRTKVDDSGVIDPRKMKDYKIYDDIFKKNTTVKSGKNHGIIMFVDFSGSMDMRMEQTMKQILIMVMFARKVNLPFEVYAFTDFGNESNYNLKFDNQDYLQNIGKVMNRMNNECLFHQILTNTMMKKDLEEQMKLLYARSISSNPDFEQTMSSHYINVRVLRFEMGGTPLNQSILASEHLINDFKDKNNVQICNTVFLTDGMSNSISWSSSGIHKPWFDSSRQITSNESNLIFDTKTKKYFQIGEFVGGNLSMQNSSFVESAVMYKILQDRVDTNLLIYFIGHNKQELNHHYKRSMPNIKGIQKIDEKELGKDGVAEVTLTGKDSYFLIDDSKLRTEDLNLDKVKTDKNVKNEFKKQSKNKKNSRVFAKKILNIISQDMS